MHQDEDPADKKRRQARERKARWVGKQSQESLKRIREAKAASLRGHIQQLTPDQAIARRAANAATRRRHIQQLTPDQAIARRAANAATRRRHIQQLTLDQAFQGFPKWSVLILQLPQ